MYPVMTQARAICLFSYIRVTAGITFASGDRDTGIALATCWHDMERMHVDGEWGDGGLQGS